MENDKNVEKMNEEEKEMKHEDLFQGPMKYGFTSGDNFARNWLAALDGRMTQLECMTHNYVDTVGKVRTLDIEGTNFLNELVEMRKEIHSMGMRIDELANQGKSVLSQID